MMTPVCPRLLNLNNDFVLLRFWARAPEDLSAIEVIYIIIISRSLPGPWPGQHYFVQFIVLFYLCVTWILYTVFI